MPIVPEISLIFEKPVVQNLDNGNTNSSSKAQAKLMKSAQFCGNMTECHNSVLPILDNNNSYAIWKQRKYSQRINSADATDISPSYKNASNRNHISQSLQDPSIQNHQETDKIYDTQNTLINAGSNNGKYEKNVKFKCSNVDNSDDLVREKQFSYGKQLSSCNSLQRTSNVIMRTKRIPNDANSSSSNKNELLACTEHPYSTIDINAYPFQQFYIPNYSNCNTDNNETIKTLLQLVNSQSEQIKNLQLQVNRLVQMQERSFRNKSTCVDSSLFATQTCDHSPTNYYSTTHTCNSCSQKAEIQNIKKNRHHTSIVEKRNLENYENKNDNKLEVTLEPKSQKAFVEQKVSIGVMTSFEFTVQNNPLLIDSEVYNKKEAPKECNDVNKKNYITSYDSIESAKKCRNQFALKSGTAQLENIVEDTESYLSSNQQQSSDFNTGSSVKDSERHTYVHCPKQLDIYNTTDILESSKTYPQHAANLNQERTNDGMYITYNKIEEQIQNAKKASRMSMHVDHDSVENENCNKMFVNKTNDHSIVDVEKNKDKIMINTDKYRDSASNISVTNHCKNHREHDVKQINSVGDSIMLSRGDLKILERPPTPEPSIHVEMQEYSTDDESDKPKRSSKIGWTFYNNVLGQVNEILQNSGVIDNQDQNNTKIHHVEQKNDTETRTALKTVKATTLEQLRRLGISLSENNEYRESNNKTYVLICTYLYL